MKKQTKDTSDDENQNEKTGEENKNDKNEKSQTEEVEKVKKARKMAPKFSPEMLNDPHKGIESLYKKVERLDQSTIKGDKESLAILMRIYQQWIFQLFPANFGDMCSKLNQLPAVKKIVKSFVFDKKGFGNGVSDRILSNFIDDDDDNEKNDEANYQQPIEQPQEKSHFLDDNDDFDISIEDNFDNQSVQKNSQANSQTSEILDFIGPETQ